MIPDRQFVFLVGAVLACAPLSLRANGLRLPSQDGFATARGEAFVATADNASAIYYNPAGISQLAGQNVRAGGYGIYLDQNFKPPAEAANAGNSYHQERDLAGVPQFFYAYTPKEFPLSFGLGVYAPFGGSVGWPQDTGFRTVGTTGIVTYVRINPVMALKLAPNFSIAGGLTVNYADTDLRQGVKTIPRPPNYFRFEGDGWGVGYNLGALWQVSDQISVGATYRSLTPVTLNGYTEVQKLPQVQTKRRDASLEYDFPIDAAFGISYRPTPRWNLEFNADYTDWSSFSTLTIAQSSGVPAVTPQDINLTLGWQPSWLYSFGATRYLGEKWHVSAGYAYSENSVPDKYFSPLVPDMDLHFFSAGAGYKGKRFNFDLAYQFGYGPSRTVSGSTPSSAAAQNAGQTADGTYSFRSHAVLLTVGMNF